MKLKHLRLAALAAATHLLLAGAPATAADLLSGFGADGVYGEIAMLPNDDGSSNALNLPFMVNFFGTTYDRFFVNNNGNITFGSPLGTYTPDAFPVSNQPMIAPWWADVDTSIAGSGGGGEGGGDIPVATLLTLATPYAGPNNVYVGSPNADTLVVTWDRVGYFTQHTDKTNNFQLVLRNRADTGAGNFDIDFRYQSLTWTTGDASGGSGGFGGTPAQAGYDAGNGVNYFTLPGSRTHDVLNLASTSNTGEAGLWTFAVRNGQTPGNDPSNPFLPVVVDGSYEFDFNVQPQTLYFIDPDVAVGYNYALDSAVVGQSFHQLVVSTNAGDGVYDLYLWNGTEFVDSGVDLAAGDTYTFASGVTRFSLRGIEVEAGLDPSNTQAFVVGVSFTQAGVVGVTQTPLTVSVPVPEPQTYALMLGGLAALGAWTRRRRQPR